MRVIFYLIALTGTLITTYSGWMYIEFRQLTHTQPPTGYTWHARDVLLTMADQLARDTVIGEPAAIASTLRLYIICAGVAGIVIALGGVFMLAQRTPQSGARE